MPDDTPTIGLRVADTLAAVDPLQWDACALAPGAGGNPFLSYRFLKALEDSKSVGRRTGWQPQYLLAEEPGGDLLGAVPLYVKGHSQGEYVFDHGWAQAFERAGGRYYPKLQAAIPFTPVPGPRLFARPGPYAGDVRDALIDMMAKIAGDNDISSVHVTFCTEAEWKRFGDRKWLLRLGQQFHWHNQGYRSFDDFLAALSSRKRKAIRKEREAVRREGLTMTALSGPDIRPEHWDAFFAFYMDTGGRKWGTPYLTRAFFDILGSTMADKVVLVMAEADGRPVGGALNLKGDDTLYGRYWGCLESHAFLHFEACYYQAIDYAIDHGLQRVEAGAQGDHKIQRGYLPVPTYSAHWIPDPSFRRAVADYLGRERLAVEQEIEGLMQYSPFRKENES
ncbi:MAG: N-acetyltransferase [Alphaproteobacteria bacterium]|nr:N-acetyltransferase [Alphaproteobacteria bacterium]